MVLHYKSLMTNYVFKKNINEEQRFNTNLGKRFGNPIVKGWKNRWGREESSSLFFEIKSLAITQTVVFLN